MRAFLIGCATAIILAIIGGVVLSNVQENAATAYSTQYVRLGA